MESTETYAVFAKYGVLSNRELASRNEIYLERYVKDIMIESRLTLTMARTMAFPAAVRYQQILATAAAALKSMKKPVCTSMLETLTAIVGSLHAALLRLEAVNNAPLKGSAFEQAKHARDVVLPVMNAVRREVDTLEGIVADDLWPFPTYQEMLFIR